MDWRSTTCNGFWASSRLAWGSGTPICLGEGVKKRAAGGRSSPRRRGRVRWPWQRRMRATVGAVLVDLAEQQPVRNDAQLSPAVTVCVVLKSIQGVRTRIQGTHCSDSACGLAQACGVRARCHGAAGGDDPGIAGIAFVFASTLTALPPSDRTGRNTRNRTAQPLQPCPTRDQQRTEATPAAAFHYSKTLKSEYRSPPPQGCV